MAEHAFKFKINADGAIGVHLAYEIKNYGVHPFPNVTEMVYAKDFNSMSFNRFVQLMNMAYKLGQDDLRSEIKVVLGFTN